MHLPVTLRGDRLGVPPVPLPGGDHLRGCVAEPAEVAQVLGHEVIVAERDTDPHLRARRKDRLTPAAEMQWQLPPGRSCTAPKLTGHRGKPVPDEDALMVCLDWRGRPPVTAVTDD